MARKGGKKLGPNFTWKCSIPRFSYSPIPRFSDSRILCCDLFRSTYFSMLFACFASELCFLGCGAIVWSYCRAELMEELKKMGTSSTYQVGTTKGANLIYLTFAEKSREAEMSFVQGRRHLKREREEKCRRSLSPTSLPLLTVPSISRDDTERAPPRHHNNCG